jgi:hypothetical protein
MLTSNDARLVESALCVLCTGAGSGEQSSRDAILQVA